MPTTASCSAQTHSALSDIDVRRRYLQPFGELPTNVVSPGAGAEGRYRLSLSGSAPLRRPASQWWLLASADRVEPATGSALGPTSCLWPGPIVCFLPAFTPGGIGECRDLMGAGALRNSVREGRDAGMGRFHRSLALLGCTSRVLWPSDWAPHLLLPEVEPVRRFLEPRIEPLLEPPGATLLLPDTSRQPLGISNSGVAQRHQVIPELTLPFLRGQTEHAADHWQTVSLPGPHDFHIEFGRPGLPL